MCMFSCPPATHCCEGPGSVSLLASPELWVLLLGPPQWPFLQAEKALVPQSLLRGQVLQLWTILVALPWVHSSVTMTETSDNLNKQVIKSFLLLKMK